MEIKRIVFLAVGTFSILGGAYMVLTKKPTLFHKYHYAKMSAESQRKLAVYGGLVMFIVGIAFIGFQFIM